MLASGALAFILKEVKSREELFHCLEVEVASVQCLPFRWILRASVEISPLKGAGKADDSESLHDWLTSVGHSGQERKRWLKVWRHWAIEGEFVMDSGDEDRK